MIAGTLKMSLKWFIPSIIIGRGIGVATVVFGLGAVPFEKFTSLWHWILFVGVCAIGIAFVFYISHKLNKWMDEKRKFKRELRDAAQELNTVEIADNMQND